ncbi:MAG: tyrosine-protein phosphatase [Chloroflexota bacterium]
MQPFFLAEPRTILGALTHVRGRYGSVREYLSRMGGVTPDILQQVRDNLLT